MAASAAYDAIADWYEDQVLAGLKSGAPDGDPLDLRGLLRTMLGTGGGPCLEVGCGTGIHAAQVRDQGWRPFGVELSRAMLRYARGRLPAVQADAGRLPVRTGSVPAVLAMLVHTDMPAYPAVVAEAARVLRPGGVFVHVGVHPCFCGGFADRSDSAAVVLSPGYLDGHWTTESWNAAGVRAKVGAAHWPLPELLHAFTAAGLVLERFAEGGAPVPAVLAVRARKPL